MSKEKLIAEDRDQEKRDVNLQFQMKKTRKNEIGFQIKLEKHHKKILTYFTVVYHAEH